jgi:hypothetical protein
LWLVGSKSDVCVIEILSIYAISTKAQSTLWSGIRSILKSFSNMAEPEGYLLQFSRISRDLREISIINIFVLK